MDKKKVLIADDEVNILMVIGEELKDEGYVVDLCKDGDEACEKIQQNKYDIAVLDIRMPKKDGIYLLNKIKNISPKTIVIMMTAFGTIENAVEAIKIGAYDYLTKPFSNDELILKIRQALKIKDNIANKHNFIFDENDELIGKSKQIEIIKAKINKVKDLNTTILLTGESGTGKGVIAKMIHNSSKRHDLPNIHVNCAVLPENLIESELFGHERGAFTGAIEAKKGKFELAGKGTIFLDEISTLTLGLQAKLLTVLQEREMERIGGTRTVPVEARIITATNENLEELVKRKEFREDLFYRLNVVTIEIPPLRYRKEDIEPLTLHFLKKCNIKLGKDIQNISDEAWNVLKGYEWLGNVRELENAIESSVALSNSSTLYIEDLPLRISNKFKNEIIPNLDGDTKILEMQEIETMKRVLEKFNGNREKASKALGISKRTLQYKIKKYKL